MGEGSPGRDEAPTSSEETAALIRRGRAGDRQALKEMIIRYKDQMARFVVSHTGSRDHYEDLCQIIFVRMVMSLKTLRSTERFEAWLFQIARNVCRDHLRQQIRRGRMFVRLEPQHERMPAEVEVEVDEEALQTAVSQLPESQRRVLELSLQQKRSYEELAGLTHSSIAAVKSRLFRAREALVKILTLRETR